MLGHSIRQRSLRSYTAFGNECILRAAVLVGGEASARIQAGKRHTNTCAILKAGRNNDLTTFLGKARLASIFGSVPDSLGTLFRSAALDALPCK